jgi:hypothetical protein
MRPCPSVTSATGHHLRHRGTVYAFDRSPVSVRFHRGTRFTFERDRPDAIAVRPHQVQGLHPFHSFVTIQGPVAQIEARAYPTLSKSIVHY